MVKNENTVVSTLISKEEAQLSELDELMEKTILAMRSCEANVAAEQDALCG